MKKNLVLLILCFLFAQKALAETTIPWTKEGCESVKGTWVTAHSATDEGCDAAHCNGVSFCQSPNTVTWWSAFTWCKGIGKKLVDLETACPNGLASSNTCANLQNILPRRAWTNVPSGTRNAYGIASSKYNPDGGRTAPAIWERYKLNDVYALCME